MVRNKKNIAYQVLFLVLSIGIESVYAGGSRQGYGSGYTCNPGTFMTGIYFPRGTQDNADAVDNTATCAYSPVTGGRVAGSGSSCPSGYIVSDVFFPRSTQDNASSQGATVGCYSAGLTTTVAGSYYTTQYGVGYDCPSGSFINSLTFPRASQDNASVVYMSATCVKTPPPTGSIDVADCNSLAGWAYDPSNPSKSIDIHVYKDWPAGSGGTMVGAYTANNSNRQDVNSAFGITGNHGFSIPLPEALKDGAFHGVYFYAIAASGAGPNPQLSGSPKYINGCKQPVAPSVQIKFGLMDKIKSSLENIFVAMKTAVTPEKVLASIIK